MQPDQYIKPIDFSSMLSKAVEIQHALTEETRTSTSLKPISCTIEALYNIIQEATENEDLELLLIDSRTEQQYIDNHITQAINIPWDQPNPSLISSTICSLGIQSTVHPVCCIYGETLEEIDVIVSQLSKGVDFHIRLLICAASFDEVYRQFPFITSRHKIVHGVLPISLGNSSIFLSSSEIDSSLFPSVHKIDLSSLQTFKEWLQVIQSLPTLATEGIPALQSYLFSLPYLSSSSSSSSLPLLLTCDSVYDYYPQLLALLFFKLLHPSLSMEECYSSLRSSWKSYSLSQGRESSLSSTHCSIGLGEWLDTSRVDLHMCKSSDKLTKIISKFESYTLLHNTPCDIDTLLDNPDTLLHLLTTWPLAHLFPLLDLLSLSLRTCPQAAQAGLVGPQSPLAVLLQLVHHPEMGSCPIRDILLQLMCECVSEAVIGSLALPLLKAHSPAIQDIIINALNTSRPNTIRAALVTMTVIARKCGFWYRFGWESFSEDVVVEEITGEEEELPKMTMTNLIANWCSFIASHSKPYLITLDKTTDVEMTELLGMIAFFLDNDCERGDLRSFYPILILQYTLLAKAESCRHSCGGCFGWLREKLIALFFE